MTDVTANVEVTNENQPAVPEKAGQPAGQEATPAITYAETGDVNLDAAHRFLAKAGISADSPAYKAAEEGNFDLLAMELSQAGIPGWEQAIALGKKAYESSQAKVEAAVKAVGDAVLEVSESLGVDWEETVKWARETGTDEEKAALNKMMRDPFTAKIAAFYLGTKFAEASGTEKAPAPAAQAGAAAAAAPVAGGPLSRVEFAEEAAKLRAKMGDAYITSPEYQALGRRLRR